MKNPVKIIITSSTIAPPLVWGLLIFSKNEITREAFLIWALSSLATALVTTYFFYKNRKLLNEITIDPSKKNAGILFGLIFGKRKD